MGRYYEGDIDGKFWFAIQSSDDGEFFGAEEQESNWIDYYLDKESFIESDGINKCKKALKYKYNDKNINLLTLSKKHDKYSKENPWTIKDPKDKDINIRNPKYLTFEEYLQKIHNVSLPEKVMSDTWEWLARLHMGMKMKKFFDNNPEEDYLSFQAEC